MRPIMHMPILLDLEEASRFIKTTPGVVEALAKSGQLASLRIGTDPEPKFTVEGLVDYIERASKAGQ